MNYTIVTAFYGVREKENNEHKDDIENKFFCTPEHYFKSAEPFFHKSFPMIIFTEPHYEKTIWELRPVDLHPITRVIVMDYEQLPFYNLYPKFLENHNTKHSIWNLRQEKFTALFKFIVNMKTEFVKMAIMMNPFSSAVFAWMDMRLHCVYDMSVFETTRVFAKLQPNRVLIEQMSYTTKDEVANRADFYSVFRGKVAAGFFAGHAEPLYKWCNLCADEFKTCIEEGLAPTDEMIYSYIVGKNPDIMDASFGDYGEVLKNLIYVRNNAYLALNFLATSFAQGNHYYTARAAEALRLGYFSKAIELSPKNIHDVWYYNYVANYWIGHQEHCKVLLNELYDLAAANKGVAKYISDVFDFFKHMISYINDNELVERFNKFKDAKLEKD